MFADDIVYASKSGEQVKEALERWRYALERKGMNVSRTKIEYGCVNKEAASGMVKMQRGSVGEVEGV